MKKMILRTGSTNGKPDTARFMSSFGNPKEMNEPHGGANNEKRNQSYQGFKPIISETSLACLTHFPAEISLLTIPYPKKDHADRDANIVEDKAQAHDS